MLEKIKQFSLMGYIKGNTMVKGLKENLFSKKRKGAFAFEYIIVLAIMVVVITSAWGILGGAIEAKAENIKGLLEGTNVDGFTTVP